jgi:SAM-dependent methyltransferase
VGRLRLRAVGIEGSAVVDRLREAYDRGAADRDRTVKEPWKLAEREAFLARLRERRFMRLLELGAGTGQDSEFFQRHGLEVVAVDLSPAMVERCREKGIDARVMDFRRPDFPPESFDAVYAVNCLLHVPNAELPDVLLAVRELLRPGGLFLLGVYGGDEEEGVAEQDWHEPPRFFSFRSDEQLQRYARESFEIVDFHGVDLDGLRFQSLTLRRPT